MGFFSDIKAMKDVSKIKVGGMAKLSISQITCLITNMPDAQKNLSPKEFSDVYALYKKLRKCNTKLTLDMNGYIETAIDIIKRFDKIAPYEKYSGGNETEFAFMMDDIRSAREEFTYTDAQAQESSYAFSDEDEKYTNYIIEQSSGQLSLDDAQAVIKVLYCFRDNGKTDALKKFDLLANRIINENSPINAMIKISYLSGLLYSNGMLSKNESDNLSKKYADSLMETVRNSMENK